VYTGLWCEGIMFQTLFTYKAIIPRSSAQKEKLPAWYRNLMFLAMFTKAYH